VHTLAAHTFNDINALPPDMQPYMKSSGITHLSLDEADLGEAALDIQHRYYKDQGHAANPYASLDFRLPSYIWNSEHSIRPLKTRF
jgi:hypothetical protein